MQKQLSIVAEEFGYEVEFITADIEESIQEVEDAPEDLQVKSSYCNGNGSCRSW